MTGPGAGRGGQNDLDKNSDFQARAGTVRLLQVLAAAALLLLTRINPLWLLGAGGVLGGLGVL